MDSVTHEKIGELVGIINSLADGIADLRKQVWELTEDNTDLKELVDQLTMDVAPMYNASFPEANDHWHTHPMVGVPFKMTKVEKPKPELTLV